jgi:hypothetical protein
MKTKQTLFLIGCLMIAVQSYSQNPYESLGVKVEPLTLSKGKYVEFFDNDVVVQIGTVLFNTQTNEIVAFLKEDTLRSEATLKPEVISRWLSPDPLAKEFPSWSPYNYVLNNPIRLIDPDGRAPDYYEGPDGKVSHRNSTTPTINENGTTLKNIGQSYVSFNGTSLDLHYQTSDAKGNLSPQTYSTPAVSGRADANGNFDYSKDRQAMSNAGPLPEGNYSINPKAVQEMGIGDDLIGKASGLTSPITGQKFGSWPGGSDAWGFSRLDINPSSVSVGGNTRSGFTIHGGTSAGSAGCIDCMSGQRTFFSQLQQHSGGSSSVLLKVDYSGLNKPVSSPFK